MLEDFELVLSLIRHAKGSEGDEGYLVSHLDEAENCLGRARESSERLLLAARCALGHLTGNMDGDMDIGDPIKMLRDAVSAA